MLAVYSGTAPIEAHEEAEVIAKVGGEVRQIYVEEGDTVKSGQILARLDGDRLRLTLAQIEANLRKQERDYKRQLDLSEKGLVAKGTAENSKFDLDALRASYDSARLELSYTEIRAPIDGVVSARHIKLGNTIKPRSTRRSGSRTSIRWSRTCTYRRRNSASLRPGRTRTSSSMRSAASITSARSRASARRWIRRRVRSARGSRFPTSTRRVKPGMFARVNIVYDRRPDTLQLPRTAILDADGQQSVYVVANGKAQQRVIRTGLANGGWIEVLDGLQGNERVVTVGQAGLKTGTPVKVVERQRAQACGCPRLAEIQRVVICARRRRAGAPAGTHPC